MAKNSGNMQNSLQQMMGAIPQYGSGNTAGMRKAGSDVTGATPSYSEAETQMRNNFDQNRNQTMGKLNSMTGTIAQPSSPTLLGGAAPQTTFSKYLKPTSTGTSETNRTTQGADNVNPNGNNSTSTVQQKANPYANMGNYGFNYAAPNAMDAFTSNYGNGGYQPAWAKEQSDTIKKLQEAQTQLANRLKPAETPTANAGGAANASPTGGWQDSNAAANALNSKLTRGLNPDEMEQLQKAVGFTGGTVTPEQMAQAQQLIRANRPELIGAGGF